MVAVQRSAQVVDVTGMAAALELRKQQQESADSEHTDSAADTDNLAVSDAGDSQQQGAKPTKKSKTAAVTSESSTSAGKESAVSTFALPSRITQFEIRSPSEDKDALTYLFLLKVSGYQNGRLVEFMSNVAVYTTISL